MKHLLTLSIAAIAFSAVAMAQEAGPLGGVKDGGAKQGREHGRVNQMAIVQQALEKLDLSAEQKAKLKVVADTFRADVKKLREEAKKLKDEGKTPTAAEARKVLGKKMRDRQEALMDKINEVLTPEQRTKFVAYAKEARERAQNRVDDRIGKGKKGNKGGGTAAGAGTGV